MLSSTRLVRRSRVLVDDRHEFDRPDVFHSDELRCSGVSAVWRSACSSTL
jgi:hypothetical protein